MRNANHFTNKVSQLVFLLRRAVHAIFHAVLLSPHTTETSFFHTDINKENAFYWMGFYYTCCSLQWVKKITIRFYRVTVRSYRRGTNLLEKLESIVNFHWSMKWNLLMCEFRKMFIYCQVLMGLMEIAFHGWSGCYQVGVAGTLPIILLVAI